jgi:hypothetical protein
MVCLLATCLMDMIHHDMDVASVNQNYAHGVKEACTEMLSALFCGHVDSQ